MVDGLVGIDERGRYLVDEQVLALNEADEGADKNKKPRSKGKEKPSKQERKRLMGRMTYGFKS